MATENYNFVVPTGDTLVAPLTQEFENWNSVDNILKTISDSAVYSATELYSLTVHAITRSKADAALFRFTAVSKYTAGDTFTVDGVAVTALLPTGEALSDGAFVIGSEVLCCLKGTLLTVYTTNAIPETVENATKLNGQSANYYATAESVATINNNLKGVILWTNPNGAVEFAAQSIELSDDISNYAYYEIEYARAYNSSSGRSTRYKTGKIPIAARTSLQLFTYYNFERPVGIPSTNTIRFEDAIKYETYGDSKGTTYNTVCIPARVIGYKTL